MRPTSYFGIAVSARYFEPKAASLVMLALALSWWRGSRTDLAQVSKTLASNPLILSTLAGVLFNLTGLSMPAPLMNTRDILGRAALGLGLICVGKGLVFSLR